MNAPVLSFLQMFGQYFDYGLQNSRSNLKMFTTLHKYK